jgi:hypothetical protein
VTLYDENILQQYADALYREAQSIVVKTAATCGFVVFIASALVVGGFALTQQGPTGDTSVLEMAVVVILTAAGAIVGVMIGRQKAFRLKLQAQQVLCQRQIEMNTRALTTQNPAVKAEA